MKTDAINAEIIDDSSSDDDEFIIMQSLVTQDYFKSLVPAVVNQYVKFKGRDEA